MNQRRNPGSAIDSVGCHRAPVESNARQPQPNWPSNHHLLNPKEAAIYVRRSESSLAKLRCSGGGCRYIKNGRRIYYDIADLDAWLASLRRRSTSDAGQ